MNGRCETDPVDQAVNVCGMCYGDYCQACLLKMKGRRHPVCKDCARTSSGVSKNAKIEPKGSRGTAKKRREEYADAAHEKPEFVYFDEAEDYVDPTPAKERPAKGRRSTKKKKGKGAKPKTARSTKTSPETVESERLNSPQAKVNKSKKANRSGSAVAQIEGILNNVRPDGPSGNSTPATEATLSRETVRPKKQAAQKQAEPRDSSPRRPPPPGHRNSSTSNKQESAIAVAESPTSQDDRTDIDENGNWIPPLLRGIDPNASQAKADLPTRRRRESDS